MKIRYRSDIDGLRAVAVLPVVAFHLGMPFSRGGYVGVDIFFVISGYLIGRGIIEEAWAGKFSLVQFYERRFRRILPALTAMLLLVSIACTCLLMPVGLVDFAKSLAFATGSVSNIWFWTDSGYFAGGAGSKPLLHTWSLAVEEQFYLVAPLILAAVIKWIPQRLILAVLTIAVASFIISAVSAFQFPNAAFYLLQSRAWELILGILAFLLPLKVLRQTRVRETAAAAGLALVAGGMALCAHKVPFPGISALPATLGAAILIATGSHGGSYSNKLLSMQPLVKIGLISYSLYLWHWPLIVIAREGLEFTLTPLSQKLAVLGLSFLAAYLSWRFVERPFRARNRFSRRWIFTSSAIAALAILSISAALILSRGLPARLPPRAQALAAFMEYDEASAFRTGRCFLDSDTKELRFDLPTCLPQHSGRPRVLIIGDSFAADLWYGLDKVMKGSDVGQITAAGCRPTLVDRQDPKPRCETIHRILRDVLKSWQPQLVIVSHHWVSIDVDTLPHFLTALREENAHVLLVGPRLHFDASVPAMLARETMSGRSNMRSHMNPDIESLDRQLSHLASLGGERYLSPYRYVCGKGGWPCRMMATTTTPMIFDFGHLTDQGSLVIAKAFRGVDDALRTELGQRDLPQAPMPSDVK